MSDGSFILKSGRYRHIQSQPSCVPVMRRIFPVKQGKAGKQFAAGMLAWHLTGTSLLTTSSEGVWGISELVSICFTALNLALSLYEMCKSGC